MERIEGLLRELGNPEKSKPYMLRVRMVCWRFLLSGGEFSCLPPGGLLITVAAFG